MENNTSYFVGGQLWTVLLLIIIYRGAKSLPGPTAWKAAYYVLLLAISLPLTLLLGAYLEYETAINNPLFVIFAIMTIIHSGISRVVGLWLDKMNLPSPSTDLVADNRSRFNLIYYEKVYLVGFLICLITIFLKTTPLIWLNIVRSWVFWLGLFLMVDAKYLQHSEIRILIGSLFIALGAIVSPLQSTISTLLTLSGFGIFIWSMVRIRNRRKDSDLQASNTVAADSVVEKNKLPLTGWLRKPTMENIGNKEGG